MRLIGVMRGISHIVIPSIVLAILLISSGTMLLADEGPETSDGVVTHSDPGDVTFVSVDRGRSDTLPIRCSDGIGKLP